MSSEQPPRVEVALGERDTLTNRAYRLLGSLTEAEDAVQETYARWFALSSEEQAAIRSPGAWLNTAVSRVCLDLLGSARVRREQYVGEWIPEPLPDRPAPPDVWSAGDPADRITLDESVDMAFLVVLDSMTPAERVAFLLHDVFHYTFAEVAEVVGRTPGACRQLASSARKRVRQARQSALPSHERATVVRDFKQAWQRKDIGALVRLLDPAVVAVADGGGKVAALVAPIEGPDEVVAYLVQVAGLIDGLDLEERTVNGQPGLVARTGSELLAVFAFDMAGRRITRIWAVRNPDKLRPWILAQGDSGSVG